MSGQINLDALTGGGKVHNLSGHTRGLAARDLFKLDDLDSGASDPVLVVVPDHIYSVSPSFIQGLFSASVRKLGNDKCRFYNHYRIVGTDLIMRQIERGMSAILTDRDLSAK